MSQAEALLNRVALNKTYATTTQTEPHIIVSSDRYITVPEKLKRLAVQYDHNTETITFDCPRYWDDIDMSVLDIYIVYERTDGVRGSYAAGNIVVNSVDEKLMHFDWTISRFATALAGKLEFSVCVKDVDQEGNEVVRWSSEVCRDAYISKGLESEEYLEEVFPDIVDHLEKTNAASFDNLRNELLLMKAQGDFNPITSVEAIENGYRLTVVAGSETVYCDLLNGTIDASTVAQFMRTYVTIGTTEPTNKPSWWLNSEDGESGVLNYKDANGVTHPIYPHTKVENIIGLSAAVTPGKTGAVPNHGVLTTGNGSAYEVRIPDLTELKIGTTFTIIPHVVSSSVQPTLNVNGFGAKQLVRRVSGPEGMTASGSKNAWLAANKPVTVMYDGTYFVTDLVKPNLGNVEGTLGVQYGGTGKQNWLSNRLLYAMSETQLTQTNAPSEDGSILRQDKSGSPYWSSTEAFATGAGFLRCVTGSYTGSGNAANLSLPVAPKVLIVYPTDTVNSRVFTLADSISDKGIHDKYPLVLANGASSAEIVRGQDSDNRMCEWSPTVSLSNDVVTFSIIRHKVGALYDHTMGKPTFMNRNGVTYNYIILY